MLWEAAQWKTTSNIQKIQNPQSTRKDVKNKKEKMPSIPGPFLYSTNGTGLTERIFWGIGVDLGACWINGESLGNWWGNPWKLESVQTRSCLNFPSLFLLCSAGPWSGCAPWKPDWGSVSIGYLPFSVLLLTSSNGITWDNSAMSHIWILTLEVFGGAQIKRGLICSWQTRGEQVSCRKRQQLETQI